MVRKLYGATSADYVANSAGAPSPGQVLPVYTAPAGVAITDLLSATGSTYVLGSAITQVTSSSVGTYPFYGPDGMNSTLYLRANTATTGVYNWYAVDPSNLATDVAALAVQVANIATGGVGTIDWVTQVVNKPVIPTTASQVGAIPTSDKGAASGVAGLDATLKVPIAQLPTGTTSTTVMVGNATPALLLAQLPAGSTITVTADATTGVYPVRPTSRTDVIVRWRGATAPAGGGTGSVASVDEWVRR